MYLKSRTGLHPSPTKKVIKPEQPSMNFCPLTSPAPFTLKPFAGLYNPYLSGGGACSLLCNHPTILDTDDDDVRGAEFDSKLYRETRDRLRTVQHNNRHRNCLLKPSGANPDVMVTDEVTAIEASLHRAGISVDILHHPQQRILIKGAEQSIEHEVPEELFRRYMQSDSRPATPSPTPTSDMRRRRSMAGGGGAYRLCRTPEPTMRTGEAREKTLLVLDLRRSQSQETMSCFGSTQLEPPLILVHRVPTRTCSLEHIPVMSNGTSPEPNRRRTLARTSQTTLGIQRRPVSKHKQTLDPRAADKNGEHDDDDEDDDGGALMKRRGRRRKKRGRDSSRGPPAVQSSIDPETMVAGLDPDSHNPSARTSLVPQEGFQGGVDVKRRSMPGAFTSNSFISTEILRQLRRELNEEIVDTEFNVKRRIALEEALKTVQKGKVPCDDLQALQKELKLPVIDTDNLLSLPRMFTRSSVRFEIPIDSSSFKSLTPLEYVTNYVCINSTRKLLYNLIFNRHRIHDDPDDMEETLQRRIAGNKIIAALGNVMGGQLSEEQARYFKDIVDWNDEDLYDYRTFAGISALSERVLGPQFYKQLPSRDLDPCHEIETVDFQSLASRIYGQTLDPRVEKMLIAIKEL